MRLFFLVIIFLTVSTSKAAQHSKTHTYIVVAERLLIIEKATGATRLTSNIVSENDVWRFYIHMFEDQHGEGKYCGYIVSQGTGVKVLDLETFMISKPICSIHNIPVSMTFHGKWGYVVNFGSDTVSIIDLKKNEVIKTLPVGNYPLNMALYGEKGYVLNKMSYNITVIDLQTQNVIKTLALDGSPLQMEVYQGKGFVIDGKNDLILVLDLEEDCILNSIKVGQNPHKIFLYKDKGYVTHGGSPLITVINLKAERTEGSIGHQGDIAHVVQHRHYLYVGNSSSNRVSVYNFESDHLVAFFDTPNRGLLDFSTTHVYSGSCQVNHLSEIEGLLLFDAPYEGIRGFNWREDDEEIFEKFRYALGHNLFEDARVHFDAALALANRRAYATAVYAFSNGKWGAEENYWWAQQFISGMDLGYYEYLCRVYG